MSNEQKRYNDWIAFMTALGLKTYECRAANDDTPLPLWTVIKGEDGQVWKRYPNGWVRIDGGYAPLDFDDVA